MSATRTLGRDGREVSALGMGCWAIGGPWRMNGAEAGWGPVDDAESTRAVHAALDAGVTLFDTAATYGAGHSERVLGAALGGHRADVVVCTKYGYPVDEESRTVTGMDVSPEAIRSSCTDSHRRLGTAHIDVYWLHVGDLARRGGGPTSSRRWRPSWRTVGSGGTGGAPTTPRGQPPSPAVGTTWRCSTG